MSLERTHVSCRGDKLQETLGKVSNGSDAVSRFVRMNLFVFYERFFRSESKCSRQFCILQFQTTDLVIIDQCFDSTESF